jgi:GNAT superfamily N-acetyltransferase
MRNSVNGTVVNRDLFKHDYHYDETLNLNWTFNKDGRSYFSKRLSSRNSFLVIAEIDRVPIGYLCGRIIRAEKYKKKTINAEVENMYIRIEYRNQGVGTLLMESFFNWCKVKGIKRIFARSYSKNKSAEKFYRKCNFQPIYCTLSIDCRGPRASGY